MSVYAMRVVVAPILGPTLGGWLTDNYSWRWVFYINLPIGLLAMAMCWIYLQDPPYLKNGRSGRIDYLGFGLLALWIGCLQIMLDKGQDDDWFSSNFIRWLAFGAAAAFVAFLVWELLIPNPIVNLRVLADRTLSIGVLMNLTVGAILFGTTAVLPQFLQNLMGYTATQSGLVMSPRGFGAIIGSIVAGRIISKIDSRVWMAQGAVWLALSMFVIGNVTLQIAPGDVIWPIILSGFAITSLFVPMTTLSVATVSRDQMGDATVFSLVRNLGGSVGISLVTAMVTRSEQVHQALLVGHMSPYHAPFRQQLAMLQNSLVTQSGAATAQHQAYAAMYRTLQQQAGLWAYVDEFRLLAVVCVLCIPLILLFRKPAKTPDGPSLAH
jgi:MFS transporter, DHA2 family, multidrug resistance protein